MLHMLILSILCWCPFKGAFGVDEVKSAMEGDSVTLNSAVTKIREDEDILWKFGAKSSLIAEISKAARIFSIYDNVADGRFRDRLKLNDKTGSLTITNITTELAGHYEQQLSGAKLSSKTFSVSVYARLPVPAIIRNSSQCSSYCSLVCSVVNVSAVSLSWYKRNSFLSSISVSDLSMSLSLPLEVEYQENNTYSCVINNTISNQTTHLDINKHCQPCLDEDQPLFYIVAISSAGTLLIVATVVMCCICRRCRKEDKTQEDDRSNLALRKSKKRKKQSQTESVYENVCKKR